MRKTRTQPKQATLLPQATLKVLPLRLLLLSMTLPIFCAIFVVDGEVFYLDRRFLLLHCLEVAKQPPHCTLDFVCRVQLMYDIWPDFLSGDTEWTLECSSGVTIGKRVYFLLNELCETQGYIGPRVTI